jgi:hypothetical protein
MNKTLPVTYPATHGESAWTITGRRTGRGLAKVSHYRLRHKEHAFQIDVQDSVEVRFCDDPEIGAHL